MSEREPEEPARERRHSAVEMRQAERTVRRYGMWVMLALFGGPILLFLLLAGGSMLTMAGSGIIGLLETVIAIPIALIFNLVQGAIVLAIPALVLGGAGYAIYRQYRPPDGRQQTASPELISRFSPQIARLEMLRQSTRRETRKRLLVFLPMGLLVAGLVGTQLDGGHSDFGLLGRVVAGFVLVGLGAIIPWMLAVSAPHKRYAETFKRELMPALLADRGELRYVEDARSSRRT